MDQEEGAKYRCSFSLFSLVYWKSLFFTFFLWFLSFILNFLVSFLSSFLLFQENSVVLMQFNINLSVSLSVCLRRTTRACLSSYQEQCDAILTDVNEALNHLDSLQKQYLFVSTKTGTLHEACEQLLKEQVCV